MARRVEMVREEGLLCDYWITRRERAILRALDELEAEMAKLASPLSLAWRLYTSPSPRDRT